ncbi:MAG: efflux RND transporter permease subunit [Bacteroides sp.]|nr:efflux RND transporter permease subunit [Bacteroides sp.]
MLDKIIKFSLDNRLLIIVLSIALMIGGMMTLFKTEVDIFPDLNAPTVVVMTEAPGMAPEEVEQLVTFPIETSMNGASGVRRVRSSSATGFSVVWVEFGWDTEITEARQTVAEKLPALQSSLPAGAGMPTLGPPSSILGEILIIGLTSESLTPGELRSTADRLISPRLLAISGVSQVSVIGGEVEEYSIILRPEKMRHLGVSLAETADALENFNSNASGGILYDYGNEYLLKATLATSDVDEMGNVVVKNDGDTPILLSDIADIKIDAKTPEIGKASLNGESAVIITLTKQPGVGSIELTDKIITELADLEPTLPGGVNINTDIFRQADFIGNSVSNLQSSLFEGAIFVIIVLFLFLMNFRTTLISALALPMSVIITILIIHLLGLTINTMTLGGIAIAIGSLVDDAIVDVENVYRRLRLNRLQPKGFRKQAAQIVFEASREVRMPILNSSLIIMASFLPLFFLDGIEGRMLIPLGVSFIIALVASTVVALTLTPVLCYFMLAKSKKTEASLEKDPVFTKKIGVLYRRLLQSVVGQPKPLFIVTGLLLVLAAIVLPTLGRSFLPSFNEGSFTINVSALPGISLDMSDSIGRRAEELIRQVPEVKLTARKTGRAELDEHSLGSNVSEIEVPYTLDSGRSKEEVMHDLRTRLQSLPGVNIELGQPISHRIDAMLSGSEAQIAVKIFGQDLDRLYSIGKEIQEAMAGIEGIVDINIEQQIPRPQIDIRPRREMLARYGITIPDFNRFVNIALAGMTVSQVNDGTLPYDVTLRIPETERNSIDNLGDLMIDSNLGPVPLSHVADIVSSSGPNTVNRENVSRRLIVSANTSGRDLRGAVNDIKTAIADKVELPQGYSITYGGQFESEESASRTLMLTSIGAILIIFFLLYAEFKSISQSLVILLNMPLAMIGGVLILWVTGSDLNIPAIIGFISLLGISTRNGMLLISHYNQLHHEQIPLRERVMRGSLDRLNPILMTALTSALALVPLALKATSPGNEIQAPMATVILGGLLSSTLLNIFLVPAVYYIQNKKSEK